MQRSSPLLKSAFLLMFLSCFLWPAALPAQNATETAPVLEDTPTPPKARQQEVQSQQIPISITYNDSDNLGRRLVLNLRERFNKSRLFRLSSANERTIQIVLSSMEEFEGRPGMSSVYSIIWTFSYGRDVLSNYLDGQLGFIRADEISDLAETLVAKTDEVATQYSYLFED